jgi:hypothetical protein
MFPNMTKIVRLLIFFCSLLIVEKSAFAAEEKWVFVEKNQGVTIHSRKLSGYAETEFRGTRTVNQPVEVIGAILADIPSYTRWFFKCTHAKKIQVETSSNLNFLLYVVVETPWPLWNRDVVYAVRTKISFSSDKITVQGQALQDAPIPVRENHVRVTDSALAWAIEKLDANRTMVSFIKRINAGGNLGSFLSDAGCRKTVFESLVNLGRIASDPRYAVLGEELKEKYKKPTK